MYPKEFGLVNLDQCDRETVRHIKDLRLSSGCEYIKSKVSLEGQLISFRAGMFRYVKQHSLITVSIFNNGGIYQCIQGWEILEVDLFHIYKKIQFS